MIPLRLAISYFALLIFPVLCGAQISVTVSEAYSAIHYSGTIQLLPNKITTINLHLNDYHDAYRIYHSISPGELKLVLLDGRDRKANNQNPSPLFEKILIGTGAVSLQSPPSSEGVILAIVNKSSSPVSAHIRVDRIGKRPEVVRKRIEDIVSLPVRSLNKVYALPKLSITVRPCGQINAFSTPNIIVCSELIAELSDKNLPLALWPVVLHELGHSILWAWKIPGYDNEDVVDNFAAIMLAKVAPESVKQYISWFESMNPEAEAVARLVSADKHPLSIQRARSLSKVIDSPNADMQRWDALLAPHLRK